MWLKRKSMRRTVGAMLLLAGGLLMWLAPEHPVGLILFVAAVLLEIAGITLEHRDGR